MLLFETAEMTHILRQSSDHSLLILDTQPLRVKTKARFIFDSRWTTMADCEELTKEEWEKPVGGSRMFSVQRKLKSCKIRFIEWRKGQQGNARKEIEVTVKEMEEMQKSEGSRDWDR